MTGGDIGLKIQDLDYWLECIGFGSHNILEKQAAERKIGAVAIAAKINGALEQGFIEIRDISKPGGWRLLTQTELVEVRWRPGETVATLSRSDGWVRFRLHQNDIKRFVVDELGMSLDTLSESAKQKLGYTSTTEPLSESIYSIRDRDFMAWIEDVEPGHKSMKKADIHKALIYRNGTLWRMGFDDWWKRQKIYKGKPGRKPG